jgi:radical SAM superfamily enzyme with C-terminal helix-hairpin-helix motif
MAKVHKALIIDGYVDEPACLGVPPFLSPQTRAAGGAARAAGAETMFMTMDQVRRGKGLPRADLSVVLAGTAVPGRYLRAMPASRREIETISADLPGLKVLGGPAASDKRYRSLFHHLAERDTAAMTYDLLTGAEGGQRWRTVEEWNSWLLLGAEVVTKHPDYPQPLIVEVETYRGCVRHRSGGCSFCIEPTKGAPVVRDEVDIISECRRLRELGVVNFRLGGQTCIVSYKADLSTGDPPRPNPEAVEGLFAGLSSLGPRVLHVDNANPAVVATYPVEARAVLRSLVRHCTSGNVVALGLESAEPSVARANNLNRTSEQALDAIRVINEEGGEVGPSGLPMLLPGLNFIIGLENETERTLEMNEEFLRTVLAEGLLLRRINVRQVIPVRRPFPPTVGHSSFLRFKEMVRREIDLPLMQRLLPRGRVLREVYTELRDGNLTFGRQVGTYPLLVGIPYPLEVGRFVDVAVTEWGYRSVTAIEHPLPINRCSLKALEALPGVGSKRAMRIFRKRPIRGEEELAGALDDVQVATSLLGLVSFGP